jgi:hypothetical protein
MNSTWLSTNVSTGHGVLGQAYGSYQSYVSEGDTPSFLHLINNGLEAHEDYTLGGWGGRTAHDDLVNKPNHMTDRSPDIYDDGNTNKMYWRWIPAAQNDFQARMDWCVATTYAGANHQPVAAVVGSLTCDVAPGQTVTLDATGSTDPDGDELTYLWWQYYDADSATTVVTISNSTSMNNASFVVPNEIGKQIHIILEVTDDGTPPLVGYRRIIYNITEHGSEPEAPAIVSTAPTDAYVGELYSYDVQATGYPVPTFSLVDCPAGMTINATTGLIAWTPAAAGDYDVTVVAANGVAPDAVQSFTITASVRPSVPPTITSAAPADAIVGRSYSYDVEATGYPAPTFSLSDYPAGMTIDAETGLIEWTPASAGFFNVSVVASNGAAPDAVQSFTIEVSEAADFVLRLNVNGPTVVNGGVTWESDAPYGSGGNLYTFSGAPVDTAYNNIQEPIPTDGIYKSVRYYDHSFAIPVPQSGDYLVRMHWVDYHTDVRDNYYEIEGVRVLEHFDPKNFGGIGKAVAKEFQVTVTDGVMNIVAGKASGKGAITSAIEIMSVTPPPLRIYGTVANVLGVPVEGVVVTAQNGGGTDTTDAEGYYEVLVPCGWSNTLTATKADYSFVPPTLVLPATADQVGNFAARLNADIDNSGIVDPLDLQILCYNWLTEGDLITGDLDESGFIDLLDFSKMAEYWLAGLD